MNNLTKLKLYLDRCFSRGNPTNSKFRIISRSYNDKLNQHEITIFYSYKNADDLPVTKDTRTARKHARSLYDEITGAKKVRLAKQNQK